MERVSEAERGRSVLVAGVVVFRWAALGWMTALAATQEGFRRPALAWAAIGAAGAWTASRTILRRASAIGELWFELALAAGLVVTSGLVVPDGAVVSGRPFFATAWPAAAVLAWGVARGARGGSSPRSCSGRGCRGAGWRTAFGRRS